jgi:hypothetical protein
MSVMLDWTSAPFVRCGKISKYVLRVATLVARHENEAMVVPMVGSGRVCVWRESGFSRREDVFIFNYFIRTFYKFYTSNAICKDNATIICITVQHENG